MTVNYDEMLSALVDGELQGDELELVLQHLHDNEQAQQTLLRYQASSDVIQGHMSQGNSIDLTASLSTLLAEEPVYSDSSSKQKARIIAFPQHIWKQASGLAVAASVGALAVLGVISQPEQQLVPTMQTVAYEVAVEQVPPVSSNTANRWTVEEPEVESRLNTYLVDHNEYAGASDVFSYARVVSYEVEQ